MRHRVMSTGPTGSTVPTRAPGLTLISSTIAMAAFSLLGSFAAACRSTQSPQGDVAVNAPATGVAAAFW